MQYLHKNIEVTALRGVRMLHVELTFEIPGPEIGGQFLGVCLPCHEDQHTSHCNTEPSRV